MTREDFNYAHRKAWAYGRSCQDCGTDWPSALENTRYGVLCRQCRLKRAGRSTWERHHVFGRAETLTIPLPANVHAAITEAEAVYGPFLATGGRGVVLLAALVCLFIFILLPPRCALCPGVLERGNEPWKKRFH